MNVPIELKGITWNHTRGRVPLEAVSQRYHELHPEVSVRWEVRSLQAFADQSLETLVGDYDLLVIDHPHVGEAAAAGVLAPFPIEVADHLRGRCVGQSLESYEFNGELWALPIDAAAPVCAVRADLLERAGLAFPRDWDDVLAMATEGLVIVASIPIDSLMNTLMLVLAQGVDPLPEYRDDFPVECWENGLADLHLLISRCPREALEYNPIAVYDRLTDLSNEKLAVCPFAYGYSVYAMSGYAEASLTFGDLPTYHGKQLRSVLGGTGLAISSDTAHLAEARALAEFMMGEVIQRGIYVRAGGQPGETSAWLDEEANRLTHNYFRNTLAAVRRAWVRPRCADYLTFQDAAGMAVSRFLRQEQTATATVAILREAWCEVGWTKEVRP